jgi:hypothetical protein
VAAPETHKITIGTATECRPYKISAEDAIRSERQHDRADEYERAAGYVSDRDPDHRIQWLRIAW